MAVCFARSPETVQSGDFLNSAESRSSRAGATKKKYLGFMWNSCTSESCPSPRSTQIHAYVHVDDCTSHLSWMLLR